MRNSRDQRYTLALGVGAADIFFILLSFFLVLTLAAEKAKKEEPLYKLPFYLQPPATQIEKSVWNVEFSKDYKDWGKSGSKAILWVTSVTKENRYFVTDKSVGSEEFIRDVEDFFRKFLAEEEQKHDITRIMGFDIYGDYGTPYGTVYEVVQACSKFGKIHSIMYRVPKD